MASSSTATPSRMRLASHRARSCSSSGTSSPSGPEPSAPSSVRDEEECEEPSALRVAGDQRAEQSRQPDGLLRQLDAMERVGRGRLMPFVEDQVDHLADAVESLPPRVRGRDLVRDAGVADLALHPDEPLRHGGLGHEHRARDLGGLEPPDGLQRQGDARLQVERRVAAREDQAQPVVLDVGRLVRVHLDRATPLREVGERGGVERPAAGRIGGPVRGRREEPRARSFGDASFGPRGEGLHERVMQRVLGRLEVAHPTEQRREHRRPLLAADPLGGGAGVGHGQEHTVRHGRGARAEARGPRARTTALGRRGPAARSHGAASGASPAYDFGASASKSQTGRISTVPFATFGIFAAQSIASSRFAHSTR